jgi:hypothetical protein
MSCSSRYGDSGEIISGWLLKVAAVLTVLGIAIFDAISIGTTFTTTEDTGNSAARTASEAWTENGKDIQKAYDAALAEANDGGGGYTIDPKTFVVDPNGTVHLTIHRTASTIVVRRIGPIKHWADVSHRSEGTYLP